MNKLLIIGLLLLAGCTSQYKEVSEESGYMHRLNTSYSTLDDMYISGVNMPPGYGDNIDIYIIGPIKPTWIGPEVITRDILKKGTQLTIQKIKKCSNCFDEEVQAIVIVESYVHNANVPVQIDLKYINPKYVRKNDKKKGGQSPIK